MSIDVSEGQPDQASTFETNRFENGVMYSYPAVAEKMEALTVAGADHTVSFENYSPVLTELIDFLKNANSTGGKAVLVEGAALDIARELITSRRELTPEQIFEMGEQVYIAWLALSVAGVTVETWDIPPRQQIEDSIHEYGKENTLLWLLAQSLTYSEQIERPLTLETLLEFVSEHLRIEVNELKSMFEPCLDSEESVLALLDTKLGLKWPDLNQSTEEFRPVTKLASPILFNADASSLSPQELAIAAIPAEMGSLRDQNAIEKITSLRGNNALFATCGTLHAEEWNKIFSQQI